MKTVDIIALVVGITVGSVLLWYAKYANVHGGLLVTGALDYVYLVFFPPSLGLMAADGASKFWQTIAAIIVVIFNGFLYLVASVVVRSAIKNRGKW